jgi:DNA-binding SARP family transcriptional activator
VDEYPSILKIQMLGGFSLLWNGQEITDSDNRSRKVWLLLAYMICCRNHSIAQNELFSLLWGDEGTTNPVNALKTMFHRVRTMLDGLGSGAGHILIVRRDGNYTWNNAIPLTVDVEEFEALCHSATSQTEPKAQLKLYLDVLELYRGDFLPKLSSEPWIVPQSTYFHNLYLQTLRSVLPLLREQQRQSEIVALCSRAIVVEPYDEGLYQFLMRAQLDLGDQQSVIKTYETMSDLLYANFGIMPADESKALYREAVRTVNERSINLGLLREQLDEVDSSPGALLCDYDFFRIIYQAEARAVARSGDAVHIALLSATGNESKPLSRRSLDCCMDNLQDVIVGNLRRGDVVSRCSVSQYIVMLPQANYENSCIVCDRIIRAFSRQYPHSPATLNCTVQPLVPNT